MKKIYVFICLLLFCLLSNLGGAINNIGYYYSKHGDQNLKLPKEEKKIF